MTSPTLHIEHFGGTAVAADWPALAALLEQRWGADANELWLSFGGRHPALALMIRGPYACVHYFDRDGHAGDVAVGPSATLPAGETTSFSTQTPEQEIAVANELVVPAGAAIEAARQFLETGQRPTNLEWNEL